MSIQFSFNNQGTKDEMHSTQCHKMKWRHKLIKNKQYPRRNDNNFRSLHPKETENWEKEIEECARINEFKNQPPYGNFIYRLKIDTYSYTFINCDPDHTTSHKRQKRFKVCYKYTCATYFWFCGAGSQLK